MSTIRLDIQLAGRATGRGEIDPDDLEEVAELLLEKLGIPNTGVQATVSVK